MPATFGRAPIWVTPAGGLRYLLKPMQAVDPHLLDLVEELVEPGHVVWDIGANVGLLSVAAAVRAGTHGSVIALEPDAVLVGLLRRTASVQSPASAPIMTVPAAVARELDLRTFCIARRTRSTNFLAGYGSTQTGGTAESQTVVAVTLDWLSDRLPPPNLVKIDVEGAELEVLQGAARLLTHTRPTIVCEVSNSAAAVHELLTRSGYALLDATVSPTERVPLSIAPFSTLAVPTESFSTR